MECSEGAVVGKTRTILCFFADSLQIDIFLRKNILYDPDPSGEPAMKVCSARVFFGEEVNCFDRD